jgi:hypothetical protein
MGAEPTLDVSSNSEAGLEVRGKATPRGVSNFERRDKTLGHRVIVGIATGAD